jgi:hypothetical protein
VELIGGLRKGLWVERLRKDLWVVEFRTGRNSKLASFSGMQISFISNRKQQKWVETNGNLHSGFRKTMQILISAQSVEVNWKIAKRLIQQIQPKNQHQYLFTSKTLDYMRSQKNQSSPGTLLFPIAIGRRATTIWSLLVCIIMIIVVGNQRELSLWVGIVRELDLTRAAVRPTVAGRWSGLTSANFGIKYLLW